MKDILDTIAQLEKQKTEWLKKVESIDITIETLKQSLGYTSVSLPSLNGSNGGKAKSEKYDVKASHKAKIMFFLKAEQRFLHISEMAAMASSFEPNYSKDQWQERFSPALSALKKDGTLINVSAGKSYRNTFWGVAKWLGPDGKPLPSYEFDSSLVIEAGQKTFDI